MNPREAIHEYWMQGTPINAATKHLRFDGFVVSEFAVRWYYAGFEAQNALYLIQYNSRSTQP